MAVDIKSPTLQNLEAAFAGECMAHAKYRYFAKVCRAAGDEETAKVLEATADQEILHAFGHAELLFAQETLTPAKCLQYAIEGETHEYAEMYPRVRHEAQIEGHDAAVNEINEQIAESKEHAEMFKGVLEKAARRFAALARVEEKHAHHYQAQKDRIAA